MDRSTRLSGIDWQDFANRLLQRHYGPGEYQKIPDHDKGDAGMPTYALTHWVRDKAAGDPSRLPLEFVVKKLTHDSARLFGMTDRGTLEPGAKADVNVIDYDNLSVSHPEMIYDLPAGMPRLMQTANGYEKTFVSGEVVQENGKDTGARPGRIVRSA